MIVVIGALLARTSDGLVTPAGLAAGVALSAAAAGSRVEVVARIGDDQPGDGLLLALAATGIGHVATLRDPARATRIAGPIDGAADVDPDGPMTGGQLLEHAAVALPPDATSLDPDEAAPPPTLDGGDVSLALRYLADYRVVVVVHPADRGVLPEVLGAASWASAHLVVVIAPAVTPPSGLPADALLLTIDEGAEGVAGLVGRYAAAVDAGQEPAAAFASLSAAAERRGAADREG
jgi:hypothetical protein